VGCKWRALASAAGVDDINGILAFGKRNQAIQELSDTDCLKDDDDLAQA
jgi:hypothetical protein